ncbi:DNA polymerase subunit Cdc27 [Tricladium varicosporioides]|nr:DNA polymerase subunit Cdc27 [Hymenoscyphus varicosporioides]
MADYKTYLAASILTEDKIVTYRLLSRTLKVHVNTAKEMLFEFHKQQNAKKPGTIHATYLVGGTKLREPANTNGNGIVKKDGEDDYMQSSPFISSSMPQPEEQGTGESGVLTITLVKEEELEKVCTQYEEISSIHVYSIGPHPLKDLQTLSDIAREVQELAIKEDPLNQEIASKYGTITNPNSKRRSARRPPQPVTTPAPAKPKVEPKPTLKSQPIKEEPKSQSSNIAAANDFFGKSKSKAKPTAKETSNPSSKESTPAPSAPALKRDSSSIFKAFAKAKPKLKREGTDASSVAATEDEPMKDVDFDDDDDDEEEVPVAPPSKEIEEGYRKARKEREAKLRAMMEESDEELEPPKKRAKTPDVEEAKEEPKEVVKEEEEEEEPPVVGGGRRRGKRRVMKKSVGKDEEGYLVTKEVEAWESFSEDEPAPKPKPKASAPAPAAKKKGAAKQGGQGNIMSFFGKK